MSGVHLGVAPSILHYSAGFVFLLRGGRSSARRRRRWLCAARRLRSRRQFEQVRISAVSQIRTSSRWLSTARTSGTVSGGSFFPQPLLLQRQEGECQHRQGGGMVPAHPTPGFVLVQAAIAFSALEVFFD